MTDQVAALIRRVRRVADLSQRALAARLGVSQSLVAKWETGRRRICASDLARVAAVGGVELALVDGTGHAVAPMRTDPVRDRAGRRFPAHGDVTMRDAWQPGYVRSGFTRVLTRSCLGVPVDHPTPADMNRYAEGRDRLGPHATETQTLRPRAPD